MPSGTRQQPLPPLLQLKCCESQITSLSNPRFQEQEREDFNFQGKEETKQIKTQTPPEGTKCQGDRTASEPQGYCSAQVR